MLGGKDRGDWHIFYMWIIAMTHVPRTNHLKALAGWRRIEWQGCSLGSYILWSVALMESSLNHTIGGHVFTEGLKLGPT